MHLLFNEEFSFITHLWKENRYQVSKRSAKSMRRTSWPYTNKLWVTFMLSRGSVETTCIERCSLMVSRIWGENPFCLSFLEKKQKRGRQLNGFGRWDSKCGKVSVQLLPWLAEVPFPLGGDIDWISIRRNREKQNIQLDLNIWVITWKLSFICRLDPCWPLRIGWSEEMSSISANWATCGICCTMWSRQWLRDGKTGNKVYFLSFCSDCRGILDPDYSRSN